MVEEGSTTLMAGEKVMIGELEITTLVSGVLSTNIYISRKMCSFFYFSARFFIRHAFILSFVIDFIGIIFISIY